MAAVAIASTSPFSNFPSTSSLFPSLELSKKRNPRKSVPVVVTAAQSQPYGRSVRRGENEKDKERDVMDREKREEVNRKIASKKALSVILRREATKAVIEKKRGKTNSRKLLPRTILEDGL